jgi:ribosomal protein S18 acetylase RimI-like enzyme
MNAESLDFKVNASTEQEIRAHLSGCDRGFSPPLSERVELGEYSRKLRLNAVTFEAWSGKSLVGMLAAYFDARERSCFITNTSVSPEFSRRGIAAKLLAACLERARSEQVETVSLEVSQDSHPAIGLYAKFGFEVVGHRGDFLKMRCARLGARDASGGKGQDP